MRELHALPEQFDAILSLWQSFGYFDEATNGNMMKQVGQKLVPGGRFVLDIYNRAFWEKNQGAQQLERNGVEIFVENKMIGSRLQAFLTYGNGLGSDIFDWQLYTLDEIIPLGKACGLRSVLNCTAWDEAKPICADMPMMQIVFEKNGVG
jgi:SAM-dependent methyltransferase